MTDYADAEMAAKTYLKGALTAVSGRVFFAFPDGTPPLPLVTLRLISGGVDNDEAGLERPRLSFDCWAGSKVDAIRLRNQLLSALRAVRSIMLDADTFGYEVVDIASTWAPDDDARLARYVVDATFVVRA